MNSEEKLIEIILSLNFKDNNVNINLKTFFNVLLTSWESLNIEAILSNISIDNFQDTSIFYNELFNYLCELAAKSETNINANNVIDLINTLDTMLPEILIIKYPKSVNVLNEFEKIKENSIKSCFEHLNNNISQWIVINHREDLLLEIRNVFLILTRVSRIKYSENYVYHFARFLWEMFSLFLYDDQYYQEQSVVFEILLFSLSSISDQLVKFLIWKIEPTDSINNNNNNLAFRELALKIFRTLKAHIIECKLPSLVIPYVLNIIDCYDRFIGQFADAVPENELCDGYVICTSLSRPLEPDDVYEAYEQFAALDDESQ